MTKLSADISAAFYSGDRTVIPFCINDSVNIFAGQHVGRVGAVISPVSVGTDPVFIVELTDGTEVRVAASVLRLIDVASSSDKA